MPVRSRIAQGAAGLIPARNTAGPSRAGLLVRLRYLCLWRDRPPVSPRDESGEIWHDGVGRGGG